VSLLRPFLCRRAAVFCFYGFGVGKWFFSAFLRWLYRFFGGRFFVLGGSGFWGVAGVVCGASASLKTQQGKGIAPFCLWIIGFVFASFAPSSLHRFDTL
jgi:hypothetical protein